MTGSNSAQDLTNPAVKGIKHIVGIASGKGGVGKSTVSSQLAQALVAQGLAVGLLDADIYGPSQGTMFGLSSDTRPAMHDGMFEPIQALGVQLMSMAFLVTDQTPMVWRGPMVSGALQQLLFKTQWGALDVLLVDLPPGTGDIQLTLSQKANLSGVVVVTTPQDIALLDAKKAIEMFTKVHIPILGIVENMSIFRCGSCGSEEAIFGSGGALDLHQRYGVPVFAQLPIDTRLRQASDSGKSLAENDEMKELFATAATKLWQGLKQTPGPIITQVNE